LLKNPKRPSLPRRRESRKAWIPAGVYPREGGGGNDIKHKKNSIGSDMLEEGNIDGSAHTGSVRGLL
jgi:hypothetical protein